MSLTLRVELILLSLAFIAVVVVAVNRKKLLLRYSLLWLFVSAALIIIAIFPGLPMWAARVLGFETTSNFIYLLGIFFLLILCFYYAVILSHQAQQIKRLTQEISIEKHLKGLEGNQDANREGLPR